MVLHMVCNFKKCRKPLPNCAWVTSCSHAFCTEHGENEFAQKINDVIVCPACNSQLSNKFDVVQADLNPPETFRSIVLAGMSPDIIMDVAMRAMSFWSYQMEEETRYQENIGRHARERVKGMEEFQELTMQSIKAELQCNKKKIETLQIECTKQKRQAEEYATMLEERNRKIQKLQLQLENQKRHSIRLNETKDKDLNERQNVANIITNRYNSTPKFTFQPQMINKPNRSECFTPINNHNNRFMFNPVTPIEQQKRKKT